RCRRFQWPVSTHCRTLHRQRSGRPTASRKNLACEQDSETHPISAACLVFASPTPLVRPRIRHPVPCPPVIGKWASISRLAKFATYLRREWLRVLLLIVIGVIVRAPALQGERIWDDQYLSHDNPFIKSPLLILEASRLY